MDNTINNIIKLLNETGRAFCDFSLTMLVQAGILIIFLFIIDILIRRHVRATFRYWIWMLVFIKLVLPPALSLPTGIGNWFGEYFVVNSADFNQQAQNINPEPAILEEPFDSEMPGVAEFSPRQVQYFQHYSEPVMPQVTRAPEIDTSPQTSELAQTIAPSGFAASNTNSLTWQGGIFLIWLIGVLVLSVLLIQRVFFVKGLIAQSEPAKNRLLETLDECKKQLGINRNIEMKLSYNASSPAVCGLFKPVILIPANLLSRISHEKLKAILIHELSHIKRADLLVNCVQTFLQILYFYNPLLWLANSVVRKIREQAVDEMVLVALGSEAKSYTNTLIDVAEMAFSRPALSLRLVGVVESKKALSERIKHILSRPFPKSAKLGVFGLIVIGIVAVILLPMAKAQYSSQDIPYEDCQAVYEFDGISDYLEIPDNKALDIGRTFTAEVWIKAEQATGEDSIFSKEIPWQSGWTLILYSGGIQETRYDEIKSDQQDYYALTFAVGNGERFTNMTSTPIIKKNRWHHIAATFDNGKGTIFVDGHFVCTQALPYGANASVPLRIGKGSKDLGRNFKGKLADLRIWNTARSLKEIQQNMFRKLSGNEEGLIANWNTKPDSNGRIEDISVNKLNASINHDSLESSESRVDTSFENEGLVAYYPFDGDAKDRSGNNNHGLPEGTVDYVSGVIGKAVKFNGIDDRGYIKVPNSDSLKFTDEVTVSLWAYIENGAGQTGMDGSGRKVPDAHQTFVAKSGDRVGFVLHSVHESREKRYIGMATHIFTARESGAYYAPETPMKKWMHISVTAGVSGTKLYYDGKLVETDERPIDLSDSNSEDLYIGIQAGKDSIMSWWYPLNGMIDELRIYSRELSEKEVKALYNIDSNGRIEDISVNKHGASINNDSLKQPWSRVDTSFENEGLVAYYPFDGDAKDKSGNNNHGLPEGTVDYVSGVIGKAVKFNGIDDRGYIKVSNSDSLKFTDAVTVSLWAYIENGAGQTGQDGSGSKVPNAHHVFVAKSGDRVGFVVHSVHESREKRYVGMEAHNFTPRESGAYYAPETPLKKWMHIAVTFGVSGTKLYYDGELVETDDKPTDLSESNLEDLYIGIQAGKGSILPWWFPMNGMIDELYIYNRELSGQEVKALYNISSSGISDELENTRFAATLPNGVTVELLGLNYIPVREKMWWKPDGSPLSQVPYDSVDVDPSQDTNNDDLTYYTIAMRFHGRQPDDLGLIKWEFSEAAPYAGSSNGYKNDRIVYNENIHAGYARFPKDVKKTTLKLGITEKEWKTIFSGRHLGFYENGEDSANVSFAERKGSPLGVSPDEKGVHIEVVYNITDRAFRVVAVDKAGKIHYSRRSGSGGTENLRQTTASFPDLSHEQLDEFRFQVRGYDWIEFKDISLRPDEDVVTLFEQNEERRNRELEQWFGQGQTRKIREQILILRECEIFKEMEKWTSAIRELVSIGKPAVPDLLEELQRTDRGAAKSVIAFTLRAIGDSDAVPILIEVLGKSKYKGSYAVSVNDDTLLQFMKNNQRQPSTGGSLFDFIIGCPVIEITAALEKITDHTEGHEHFITRALNELGMDAEYEVIEKRNQEIIQEVADRWQKWWQENKFLRTMQNYLDDNFVATLPNGVTVELIGTCQYTDDGVHCYTPDGEPLGRNLTIGKWNKNPQAGDTGIIFHVAGPEERKLSYDSFEGADGWEGSCDVLDENKEKIEGYVAVLTKFDKRRNTTKIRLGVATNAWKTIALHDGKSIRIDNGVSFTKATETEQGVQIFTTDTLGRDVTQRIVAIDNNGKVHPWEGYTGSVSNSEIRQSIGTFPDLKLNQVKEFQFQTQPYQWVTFENISLHPVLSLRDAIVQASGLESKLKVPPYIYVKKEGTNDINVSNVPFIVPLSDSLIVKPAIPVRDNYWELLKNPAWSPDGKKIAFVGTQDDTMNVFSVNPDGSDLKQITDMPQGRLVWGLTYRPESNQLYYMDNSVQGADFHWINFTSQDGTAGRNSILMVPGGHGYTPPSFSPDGKRFCFRHYDRQQYYIKIADADGSNIKTILTSPEKMGLAIWGKGSNSDRIAFSKVIEDSRAEVRSIFTIKTDGSEEKRLTDTSIGDCYVYDWSPDGRKILFSVDGKQVCAINSDGSNLVRLTNDEYENNHSVFSPDGTKVAYISKRDEQNYICIKEIFSYRLQGINTSVLVGYWSFDGNANDSSNNRNNGTAYGATLAEGIEGQAYSFDGENDYIEMPYDSRYNFGKGDFSIEAWIYPKAYKHQAIISRWEREKWAWDFRLGWDYGEKDKMYFFFSSDTEHGIKISDTVSLNKWHHVAATRRNGVLYGYLDGVEYNAGVQKGIAGNTNANLVIGMFKGYGDGFFNGKIDEVKIYNRALFAEEVEQHYKKEQMKENVNVFHVPSDEYPTMGSAVNVANRGDKIIVTPQAYISGQNKEQIILQADVITIKQPIVVIKDFIKKELGVDDPFYEGMTELQVSKFKEWAVNFPGTNIASNQNIIAYNGQPIKIGINTKVGYLRQVKDANSVLGYDQENEEIATGINVKIIPYWDKDKSSIILEMNVENSNLKEWINESGNDLPSVTRRTTSSKMRIPIGESVLLSMSNMMAGAWPSEPLQLPPSGVWFSQSDEHAFLILKADVQN